MAVQMWSLIAAYLLAASVERPMPGIGLVGLIGFAAGLVAVDAAQMIGDAQSSLSVLSGRQTSVASIPHSAHFGMKVRTSVLVGMTFLFCL
jgi:hypothetical protein